jgi:hypothetical protein
MGENQGSPSNQLGIKIVSPTVFTQALADTEGYPNEWFPTFRLLQITFGLFEGQVRVLIRNHKGIVDTGVL